MFDSLPTETVSGLQSAMDGLTKKAGSSCDMFGTLGSIMGSEFSNMLANLQAGIASAMKAIGSVLSGITGFMSDIGSAISSAMSKVAGLVGDALSSAMALVNGAIAQVSAAISAVAGMIGDAIGAIVGAIDKMMGLLGDAVGAMVAFGCGLVRDAASAISGASPITDAVNSTDANAAGKAAIGDKLGPMADELTGATDSAAGIGTAGASFQSATSDALGTISNFA